MHYININIYIYRYINLLNICIFPLVTLINFLIRYVLLFLVDIYVYINLYIERGRKGVTVNLNI